MNAPLPLSPLADAHITLPDDALAQEYSNQLALADVSLLPRYGVKGPQAATWLANAGIAIPAAANSWFVLPSNGLIARLGVSEFLLEGAGFGAGGDPAGTHGLRDGGNFFLADVGASKGDEGRCAHEVDGRRGKCLRGRGMRQRPLGRP